jgi:serine/threonine protein kinase
VVIYDNFILIRHIKKEKINFVPSDKADENDMVELFLREALMMRGFDHPHVLSLIGITMDTDRSPLVVLPYMENGDLRTYISSPDMVSVYNSSPDMISFYICSPDVLAAQI